MVIAAYLEHHPPIIYTRQLSLHRSKLELLLHYSISILTELLILFVIYLTIVALSYLCLAHFAPLHGLLLLREVAQTTDTSHMHELSHLLQLFCLLLLILPLFLVQLLLRVGRLKRIVMLHILSSIMLLRQLLLLLMLPLVKMWCPHLSHQLLLLLVGHVRFYCCIAF